MFDVTSRYHQLETASLTLPDGRTVAYVRRRLLPRGQELPLLAETAVGQGERLDVLAARTLGDPLQYWRLCDANEVMHPLELEDREGALVRVPQPLP